MSEDFEIVESKRGPLVEVANSLNEHSKERIVDTVCDNFSRIMDAVDSIIEIKKMREQTDAIIGIMEKQKDRLYAETDAYVKKVEANCTEKISKAEVVRQMMNDFYKNNDKNLSGEEFASIMNNLIEQIYSEKDK